MDKRPPLWVGHISLLTHKLEESQVFMKQLGMRPIAQFDDIAILELRGGTHLILQRRTKKCAIDTEFDLMVDDLESTHSDFISKGLNPSKMTYGKIHDYFIVTEPGGSRIKFNSTHILDFAV